MAQKHLFLIMNYADDDWHDKKIMQTTVPEAIKEFNRVKNKYPELIWHLYYLNEFKGE